MQEKGENMAAPVREERRLVTALAADVVGSTPLVERLDPEEVRLLLGELIGRFARAAESLGGTVKDIAGDGLMALFGAPAAHEDDAERAVLAGLQIVEDVRAYAGEVARAWDVAGLAVRVGVHTGPVVLGPTGVGEGLQHAAFGDTLHTAARLQSAADPNTVLVSAATHRLVAQRFEWGDARTLALKGKEAPVTAHPVLRARMGAERTRLRREALTTALHPAAPGGADRRGRPPAPGAA
jgi:class 3 adenylate cyclase